jgi:hypothetical protein
MDNSDESTITIGAADVDDLELDTLNISSIDMSKYGINYNTLPSYTISTGATGAAVAYGTSGIWNSTITGVTGSMGSSASLDVIGDANFNGDITWKGRSLGKLLSSIEDRLAILTEPDPVKLEKFAALKKAYDNYKLLERLIGDDDGSNSAK